MVTLEVVEAAPGTNVSPRISFSADFLNDCNNFITINPESCPVEKEIKHRSRNPDFEFLSGDLTSHLTISTADELFFEGKLLPFWDNREIEKQRKMGMEEKNVGVEKEEVVVVVKKVEESRMNWFVDDDPSPRPPKCTVLWKELLRLKKQRAPAYLSPSPSSSSEKTTKGLERNRSGTLRIRPMVNVPISTHGKSNTLLPPLFPQKQQPQGGGGGGGIRRHK